MKKILNIILTVAFLGCFSVVGHSQVVMKDFLSQDHAGQVDKSANCNGSGLYYKFV